MSHAVETPNGGHVGSPVQTVHRMQKKLSQFLFQISAALLFCVAQALAQTPNDLPALSDVERELKGGETHSFKIVLASGQFLHALVEQKDIDVITAVFGPDGKQLSESN